MSSLPAHFALCHGRVVLPTAIVDDQAVVVAGSQIVDVLPYAQLDPALPQIDVGGRWITPGLIDIHIHGALGHTFNDPTPTAFAAITQENARRGVTSLLATTATDAIENLLASLELAEQWMAIPQSGAQILGVHVEGPYFSMAQRGAQDPAHIRNPDDGTVAQLLEYRAVIRMLTFAPELPGALALTQQLAELGIVAAAGHSSAREEEVKPAIDAGLRHMIHLWSAQSTTVREGPWRKPGLLEVSLTDDRLTGEIIADGKHLPPTLMKLAYQCLGPDRLCVISDATSGAGLPEGARFRLGGMEYEVCDGVGMLFDRTAFAGSTTLLNQMIPILTEQVGLPLVEVIRMASLTPARVIGVADRKGSLEAGKDADIAIFNQDFTPWDVLIGGRSIHAA
ncbi:MAG: N-acetylglucosamine-6-phosphate deacetylase [Caldilineaceae bacterium]|nr:N-acetylglucosamine-6-phosphate deacetylase [Caldilineaceae bacterium]